MKGNYTSILVLILTSSNLLAQQYRISGTVLNSAEQPITSRASILLKNKGNKTISFYNTNIDGKFNISIPDSISSDSLFLEVNCLGYKRALLNLKVGVRNYTVKLDEAFIELKEVKINKKPLLTSKGDTLNYNVSSFSQADDRSIGDVLKRMPGISVTDNGQISFNGKKISNMYIGGDDLLDGKYSLGTRTIPKGAIESVDVMQHHQQIKVLQGKSFTDDVAINLVIKNDAKLTLAGEALLALGLPKQYEVALNTILFNKKIKMLNVLQSNNIGIDYLLDLQQLSVSSAMPATSKPDKILFTGTAPNPDLPREDYYLNNSGMLNANNLYNFKSGLQIRSNIQGFVDKNRFNYLSNVSSYLLNDTVDFSELQNSISVMQSLSGSIKAMVNEKNLYLNNDIRFNFNSENNQALMALNGFSFEQNLYGNLTNFSNSFNYTPLIKNKYFFNLTWDLAYIKNPQNLAINRGINENALNNGNAFSGINQFTIAPSLSSNFSLTYSNVKHRLKQNYQLGLVNEKQHLNSLLTLTDLNMQTTDYAGDEGNTLNWLRNKFFLNSFFEFKKKKFEFLFSVPLNVQNISYSDFSYELDEQATNVFLNPSIRIKYFIHKENYLQLNFNVRNDFGNINNAFRGIILTDFRNVRTNLSNLQELTSKSGSIVYNYQLPAAMLFVNSAVNYSQLNNNLIQTSIINNNIDSNTVKELNNSLYLFGAKFGISKFIFALNTTASLNLSYDIATFNQIINSQLIETINKNRIINFKLNSRIYSKLNVAYFGSLDYNSSFQIKGVFQNDFKRSNHNLTITYSFQKPIFFTFKVRSFNTVQQNFNKLNYRFADLNLRYKLTKMKADIELDVNNLANINKYEIIAITNVRTVNNTYDIRGRMALLRATFYL